MNAQKKRSLKKVFLWLLIIFLCLLIIAEVILRSVFGFCDDVLLRKDPHYEYIPIPQTRFRFRNNIHYNSFSQRNEEPGDSSIILGFGDSVFNGGTPTDQDSLASTRLSKYFTEKYRKPHMVTNISAGSWGPDNCYAYLKKHGNFGAKKILLIVSSHDAYDNMDFSMDLDNNPHFRDEQYSLALIELFDRYLIPRFFPQSVDQNISLGINKQSGTSDFNSGFENFKRYSDSTRIPLMIYLHADLNELRSKKYNNHGAEIIDFCNKRNIPLIKEMDYGFPESVYRDNIHINEQGQRKMYEVLKTVL